MRKTIRVGFINQPWNRFPPSSASSIAIWIDQVSRRLVGPFEIRVYARRHPLQLSRERIAHVDVLRMWPGIGGHFLARIRQSISRRLKLAPPEYSRATFAIVYVLLAAISLRRWKCDLIHIHNFSQFVPIVRWFNPKAKIILHMHCDWLVQGNALAIGSRLSHADSILGCSEHVTGRIRDRFPQYTARCSTLHNGADAPFPVDGSHGPNRNTLLYVGRVSPEKGIHVLIDSFQEIAERWPKAILKIVGPNAVTPQQFLEPHVAGVLAGVYCDGDYLAYLRRRVRPELADRVVFAGGMNYAELSPHYHAAGILVNPSYSEAFGMSLVEAMMHGKPVVATSVGGMMEIVLHGETGLLVPPGNVRSLSDALEQLLGKPDLQETMGSKARQRAREMFSWDVVTARLVSLYGLRGETA